MIIIIHNHSESEVDALSAALYADSKAVVQQAAMVLIADDTDRSSPPGPLELSLVLCDDVHIQELNKEWRGVDAPTDVLSFEMGDGYDDDGEEVEVAFDSVDNGISSSSSEDDVENSGNSEEMVEEMSVDNNDDDGDSMPVTVLGDVVISLDTAVRQAVERGHSLHDECRILLVHGVLHLLGYDHENGE